MNISVSPFAPENLVSPGLAVPSRVSLLILHTQAESGAYLRGIPPEFRGGVHLFSLELLITYCV